MSDAITRLNAALEGRYSIERELGEGGMANVYLAEDLKHDRKVALKVLKSELAAVVGADRFLAEIKTTANLQHPHILPLFDSGEADGFLFYVMPYVEGETLRDRLDREHQLPVDDAVRIASDVAEALDYAHRQGVIHRDIKPANILLQDGKPVISDFGIALAVGAAGRERLTETGLSLGTPHYMSPEQATGDGQLGPTTDIYALGCVLYEMLAGQSPFAAPTPQAVLVKVLTSDPALITTIRRTVPSNVEAVLARALEKLPADRFESASAFNTALADPHFDVVRAQAEHARAPGRKRRAWRSVPILASLIVGLVVGRIWMGWSSGSAPEGTRLLRLTEMYGMEETPAVSPDGQLVAFIGRARAGGRRQVFVKPMATGEPRQVTVEEYDHSFPRWADENTLIYLRHPDEEGESGSLWESLISSSTPARPLRPAEGEADVSHSGQRIATFRADTAGVDLVLFQRDGGGTETVHRLPEGAYGSPRWSPDDRFIAFQVQTSLNTSEIQVMEVAAGGDPETVVEGAQFRGLAWLPDSSGLVYSSSKGSTLPYPPIFSLRTVKFGSLRDVPLQLGGAGYASYVEPDIAPDGRMVASRVGLESDIYRFPVDGSPLENVRNAERITRQTGQVQTPSVSPNGEDVVYLSDNGGHANVWVARVDRTQPPRQITFERDPSVTIGIARWSPTEDRIVYWRSREGDGGGAEEWLINPDGADNHLLVDNMVGGASWSHDGAWIYYIASRGSMATLSCTNKIHVDGGEPVPVRCGVSGLTVASDGVTGYFSPSDAKQGEVWTATPIETGTLRALRVDLQSRIPLYPHQYALSPDDRWLAAPLKDRGTTNLFLISTEDGTLHRITDFEQRSVTIGRQVSWTRDGKYIFAALLETDADIVLLEGLPW